MLWRNITISGRAAWPRKWTMQLILMQTYSPTHQCSILQALSGELPEQMETEKPAPKTKRVAKARAKDKEAGATEATNDVATGVAAISLEAPVALTDDAKELREFLIGKFKQYGVCTASFLKQHLNKDLKENKFKHLTRVPENEFMAAITSIADNIKTAFVLKTSGDPALDMVRQTAVITPPNTRSNRTIYSTALLFLDYSAIKCQWSEQKSIRCSVKTNNLVAKVCPMTSSRAWWKSLQSSRARLGYSSLATDRLMSLVSVSTTMDLLSKSTLRLWFIFNCATQILAI